MPSSGPKPKSGLVWIGTEISEATGFGNYWTRSSPLAPGSSVGYGMSCAASGTGEFAAKLRPATAFAQRKIASVRTITHDFPAAEAHYHSRPACSATP
jgi:hypothetical protein